MAEVKKPIPKTQREISISLQEPYRPPAGAVGFPYIGNPNNTPPEREFKVSFRDDEVKPFSVSIEDLDWAIMYYFQNVIKPSVIQNGERIPVPIIYGSPEKWKSFQADGYYRDLQGRIMAPLLMFKRDNIEKVRSIANKLDANSPVNYGVMKKPYSSRNSYSNFNILNDIVPEKEFYAVVIPDYVTVTYSCAVFTYYMDQLNRIIESVEYASDAYWGDPERFQFRAMIDSFASTTELSDAKERIVKSTFTIKMNGHIISDILQKDLNSIKIFNGPTSINFTSETVANIGKFSPPRTYNPPAPPPPQPPLPPVLYSFSPAFSNAFNTFNP
jgi:hypothetical protein